MKQEAFRILKAHNLPTAEIYSLEKALSLPNDKNIFLRYYDAFKINNKVTSSKFIRDNYKILRIQLEKKELLQIAESISSVAGCALYLKDGFIYGEYVEGNIITLLRRGICAKRFLMTASGDTYEKTEFQNWIGKQIQARYEWMPYNGAVSNAYHVVSQSLSNLAAIKDSDLLLEVLVEPERLVFCDAKHIEIDILVERFVDLFHCERNMVCLKGRFDDSLPIQINALDIDNNTMPLPNCIGISNGALLSHYMTYDIKNFKNIIYTKSN